MSKAYRDHIKLERSQPPPHDKGRPQHGKTLDWGGVRIVHFDSTSSSDTEDGQDQDAHILGGGQRSDIDQGREPAQAHSEKVRKRASKRKTGVSASVNIVNDQTCGDDSTG